MMKNTSTTSMNVESAMDSLKKNSVRIYTGMVAVFNNRSKKTLSTAMYEGKIKHYNTNNGVVVFVTTDGVYVKPHVRGDINILRNLGYIEDCLYVPFSNGDIPESQVTKWNGLLEQQRRLSEKDFKEDCEEYCAKHGIGAIDERLLENCMEIPATGVTVKTREGVRVYYPIMNQSCLDCRCENLGTYCSNNGRVVFVYVNGKTYVTKNFAIVSKLRIAGFREGDLFVPFSNGEEILENSYYHWLWKELKE